MKIVQPAAILWLGINLSISSAIAMPSGALPDRRAGATIGAQASPLVREIEKRLSENKLNSDDIDRLSRYVDEHPNDAPAHILTGKIYERQGLLALADQEFKIADKLAPSQSQAMLDNFISKLETNDIIGASDDLGYLVQRFPDDPAVLLLLGRISEGKGEHELAEKYITKALASPKYRLGVASTAASFRLSAQRYQEAYELAKRDLDRDPDFYLANAVAGEALIKSNHPDEGARYLRKAFKLKPLEQRNTDAFASDFFNAGMYGDALAPAMVYMALCTQRSDMDTAKNQLLILFHRVPRMECEHVAVSVDEILKRTPYRARFHLALGDAYDRMGWHDIAQFHYILGTGLDPNSARGYYRLALDKQREGKMLAAVGLLEKAYSIDKKDPDITAAYARVLERLQNNRNDLALQFKQSLDRSPVFASIKHVLGI